MAAEPNPDAGGLSPDNAEALGRMVRALDLAEGFALFFARCNSPALRSNLILTATQQLAALGVEAVEVVFEDEPADVRQRLRAALQAVDEEATLPLAVSPLHLSVAAEPPASYTLGLKRAVFVVGLELGIPYNEPNSRILAELNLGRDLFPRDAPHPLVFWLPDYALTAVARHAPDFWAWRSGVFEFETDTAGSSAAFEQLVQPDRSWRAFANLTSQARLLRRRQLESLLDDYRDLPDEPRMMRERGKILADLGDLCAASQDYGESIRYYQQALELIRQVGDRAGEARLLNNIGLVYDALGDQRQALDYFEQALPLRRQVGDRAGEATALNNIGGIYFDLGDQRGALAYYEQALKLQRQVGDRAGEAVTRFNMAMVFEAMGDLARAEEELARVVDIEIAIEGPDLDSDRAALERVRAERAAGG